MYTIKMHDSRFNALAGLVGYGVNVHTDMVVDTGAVGTSLSFVHYKNLNKLEKTNRGFVSIRGITKASTVTCVEVIVPMFTIGDINLGEQRVLITDNPSYQVSLLGMDILSQLDFSYSSESNLLKIRSLNLTNVPVSGQQQAIDRVLRGMSLYSKSLSESVLVAMPSVDMPYCRLKEHVVSYLQYRGIVPS